MNTALSKSRFKQGLECPNKLYFSNNSKVYHNVKKYDTFLQALASGGFQIEEYARLQYPEGILIEDPEDRKDYNYQDLADQTTALLQRENVVIFEAAFYIDHLFIRTDLLVKKGNQIKLIEVKAKSIDPRKEDNFLTKKKRKIVSGWKPYLFDLAFQTYVAQKCLPNCKIIPYLCLVDKTKATDYEGLNQLFRIKKNGKRTGVEVKEKDIKKLGINLLYTENLFDVVSKIHSGEHTYYENLNFHEAIDLLSDIRINNYYPNWPAKFSACKQCEFKKDSTPEGKQKKSGFQHCFKTQYHWTDEDFKKPTIFNVWDLKDPKLMEQGLLFKSQLSPSDIKYKEKAGQLHRTERQWLQIEKEREDDFTDFIDVEGLREAMNSWKFPLHFIDFETSTVPLPFHIGRRPYEQIAFQFSHHIYHEDGRIEHASEYINTVPGQFPNFIFMEELMEALRHDEGTIFCYSTHENTILNAIRDQLKASDHLLKEKLIAFIETISKPKNKHPNPWATPERNMVDLCKVIKKFYYNPHTYGSNSIKKVLPAILKTGSFVQNKYSRPISEIQVTSKNIPSDHDHTWLTVKDGEIEDPYKTLKPVFDDLSQEEIETRLSGIKNIDDGGAALTAYGKIQYSNMEAWERDLIADALKRYCELDTLAMVMIYEHLKSLI